MCYFSFKNESTTIYEGVSKFLYKLVQFTTYSLPTTLRNKNITSVVLGKK